MPYIKKYLLNKFTGEKDLVLEYVPYVPITITSFISVPSAVEKGVTVNNVALTWALAGPTETDQTLDSAATGHEHILPGIYTRSYTGLGLTATNIWTLWVTDGTSTDTATAGVTFYNKRYWGPDVNPGPLTDPDILALSSEFASSRQCTKYFDCTGGKYIWFAYPTSWGEGEFWVGGLRVVFNESIQDHTNASGWTESYRVYRSLYLQNGNNIDVTIT
jgi:hypothetical protein